MSCIVPESSQPETVNRDKMSLELMSLGPQTSSDQPHTGDGCQEGQSDQRSNMENIMIGLGVVLWPQSTQSGRSGLYTNKK